ncbi:MAG: winged helix-turn-helix transcriptional regulator [Halobacteriales archaeon]
MQELPRDWRLLWDGLNRALGRKWGVHVLRLLAAEPRGFNELRRALDGPTAKTLSERLTELECVGLVDRHVEASSPPSTRYQLSPAGERFADVLGELEREVEVVECGCEDVCEMITVDPDRTATVCAEKC